MMSEELKNLFPKIVYVGQSRMPLLELSNGVREYRNDPPIMERLLEISNNVLEFEGLV